MPHRKAARIYGRWLDHLTPRQQQAVHTMIVAAPFSAIAIVAITLFMYALTQPLRIEAPFVFSQSQYQPIDKVGRPSSGEVCPGESLRWPIAFDVRRAPVLVISVRSIWDVDDNQTVTLPPGTPFGAGSLQFTNYTQVTHVARVTEIVVPPLLPGHYEVRGAAQEFNSQAAAYSVPFTVREGCT